MKKLLVFSTTIFSLLVFSSCQKCKTCTYTAQDPTNPSDSSRVVEVCEKGRLFDNAIERYETNNWVCE